MTRPKIKPRSPRPLANTLPTWPMSRYVCVSVCRIICTCCVHVERERERREREREREREVYTVYVGVLPCTYVCVRACDYALEEIMDFHYRKWNG